MSKPPLSSADDDEDLRRIEIFKPVQIGAVELDSDLSERAADEVRSELAVDIDGPLERADRVSFGRTGNDATGGRVHAGIQRDRSAKTAAVNETGNEPRRGNLVNSPSGDSRNSRNAHKNSSKSDQSRNDQIDDYNLPQIPARAGQHRKRKQRKHRLNRLPSTLLSSPTDRAFGDNHVENHLENYRENHLNHLKNRAANHAERHAENSKNLENPLTGGRERQAINLNQNSNQNNQQEQAENATEQTGKQVEEEHAANESPNHKTDHSPNGTASFPFLLNNSLTKLQHRKVKRRKAIHKDNQFSLKQRRLKNQQTNSNDNSNRKSFSRFNARQFADLNRTKLRMPLSQFVLLLAPTLSPLATRRPSIVAFWSTATRLNASAFDPTSARLATSLDTIHSNADSESNQPIDSQPGQLISRQAYDPNEAHLPGQLAAQLTDHLTNPLTDHLTNHLSDHLTDQLNSIGGPPACAQSNCFRAFRSTNENVNSMQHIAKSSAQLSKGLNKTLNQVKSKAESEQALQFAQNLMVLIYLIIFLSVLLLLLRVIYIAILRKLSRRPHGTPSQSQNSARHSSQLYTQNTFNPTHLGYQTAGNNSNSNVNVSTYGGRSEANSISGGTASFIGTLTGTLIAHNAQLNRKPEKQTKDSEEDSQENKLAKSISPTSQLQQTSRTDSPNLAARPFSRQSGKFTDLNIISDEFSSSVYVNEDELSHA